MPRIKINSPTWNVCAPYLPAGLRPIHPFPELLLIYYARYPPLNADIFRVEARDPPLFCGNKIKTANPREIKSQRGSRLGGVMDRIGYFHFLVLSVLFKRQRSTRIRVEFLLFELHRSLRLDANFFTPGINFLFLPSTIPRFE